MNDEFTPPTAGWLQSRFIAYRHVWLVCGAQMFHLAACQMKPVVSAPIGAAIIEPFRWRFKVSPTRKGGGCPPPRLQLTESRRVAAGRIRGRFAYQPRPFTLWVAPLRAFFLYSLSMPCRHCSVRFLYRNFFAPTTYALSGVRFLSQREVQFFAKLCLTYSIGKPYNHRYAGEIVPVH